MGHPSYQIGRIHGQAFLVSTAFLLVVCVLCSLSRLYIRLFVEKKILADDGFLAIGLCCLILALSFLYSLSFDKMYMTHALIYHPSKGLLSPHPLEDAFYFHKWATVVLILTWCSIMAVKFSFLALFRQLVSRIPKMIAYWWFVVVLNLAIWGYGASVYYLSCPYYYSPQALNCISGANQSNLLAYAMSAMLLDIVGDLMILYIPVRIIWKVQIKLKQKVALAMSLCLTVVVIIVAIIRVCGILYRDAIDTVWEIYWLIIQAEVGIIMTTVAAFRAFFLSHMRSDRSNKHRQSKSSKKSHSKWSSVRIPMPSMWQSKSSEVQSDDLPKWRKDIVHTTMQEIPKIPEVHVAGVRTSIGDSGEIDVIQSWETQRADDVDHIEQLQATLSYNGIQVYHSISSHSEKI